MSSFSCLKHFKKAWKRHAYVRIHTYAHIHSHTRTTKSSKTFTFPFLCVSMCCTLQTNSLICVLLHFYFYFFVRLINLPGRYHLPNVSFRRLRCCISHFYNWTQYVYRWKYLKLSAHLNNHLYCTKQEGPYHGNMHYNTGHCYTFHTVNDVLTRDALFTKQKEMKRNRT